MEIRVAPQSTLRLNVNSFTIMKRGKSVILSANRRQPLLNIVILHPVENIFQGDVTILLLSNDIGSNISIEA